MADLENNAMVIARTAWRREVGNDFDGEFDRIWNDELRAKVAPLLKDTLDPALPLLFAMQGRAKEARPRLEAAKHLAARMENAHAKFIEGGALEAEWESVKGEIRSEILKRAALEGGTSREEAIRRFEAKGYRLPHPSDF